MRSETGVVEFRPVELVDLDLLAGWMKTPHWRRWWGDPETELGFIRDMVEGRDTTRPFIFEWEGEPVGYIQYWFVGEHQTDTWTKDNPWLLEVPADAIGVDLSIGPERLLSRGIGSKALEQFVDRLLAQGYRTILIDPDPENKRAVNAYRKAGFQPIRRLEGLYDDVLIMQHGPDKHELKQ